MFRAIISPIFWSTRLCVTAWCIMHPRCCRSATSWVHYATSSNTQSSAPEDWRDHRPKHVELIGIINKPLLLHLVGFYIIYNLVHETKSKQIKSIRKFVFKFGIYLFRSKWIKAFSQCLLKLYDWRSYVRICNTKMLLKTECGQKKVISWKFS